MKIWTYNGSNIGSPYWRSAGVDVLLIENGNGSFEWRRVHDGLLLNHPPVRPDHRGAQLNPVFYPKWLKAMDDMYVDEGI